MRFTATAEQASFAESLDKLLGASDPVAVARSWAAGDTGPGLALWARLAEQGVNALVIPESAGGMGASPVELTIAFEALGRHGVPGPWVESAAFLPGLVEDPALLERLAEGAVATVAAPPRTPYALDGEVAEIVLFLDGDTLSEAVVQGGLTSVDATRRLATVAPGATLTTTTTPIRAHDLAALATAAQLLGAGERLLADSVTYVKQRRQFGREIGSYQAIKHQLADVRIALDFARPLVQGAGLDPTSRAVSAAKVSAAEAAHLASRVGLQVHGAIGYTQEFDLSIWITKVRALVAAWGTPADHRARLLRELVS
ncbi:acyl-CoA dehydrogenase [Nocardioides jensenii]|uniref:acyl-CoA dehydrogenase n=1 Tax=Nocardioides jensenii TaxID=1843 RepID=UPI00082D28A6|nr:acyl-CoA dehydrogenase [Nocardioides jensenii]